MSTSQLLALLLLTTVSTQNLTRVLFGSCHKRLEQLHNPMFLRMAEQKPDMFVWLGDAAYVDVKTLFAPYFFEPNKNETRIREIFNYTFNDRHYQHLLNSTRVVGIWDDHDFNLNNGDINLEMHYKRKIQNIYLDFLQEPADSSRRKATKGIYTSYSIGEAPQDVLVVLLDVRHEKNPRSRDMLGEQQWEWLDTLLSQSRESLLLLGTGTQFLPDDRVLPESWFPESKAKLMGLLAKYQKKAVILSGDVHYAEMMRHPCSRELVGYDLWEVTSSGMNEYYDTYFRWLGSGMKLVPDTYNRMEDRLFTQNYGGVDVRWNVSHPEQTQVVLTIYSEQGVSLKQHLLSFQDFQHQHVSGQIREDCVLQKGKVSRYLKKISYNLRKGEPVQVVALVLLLGVLRMGVWVSRRVGRVLRKVL